MSSRSTNTSITSKGYNKKKTKEENVAVGLANLGNTCHQDAKSTGGEELSLPSDDEDDLETSFASQNSELSFFFSRF